MPRIDLLTAGEAFQDLIFVGLPHMPKSGEELRTQQFVSTIGGGALITATAASRLGLGAAVVSALSVEAVRALRRDSIRVLNVKRASEPHAVTVSLSTKRDRSFVTFEGINRRLESRLPAAVARVPARHVHLAFAPRNCARWTRIVERLRARGVTTSWDFGWNPELRTAAGFSLLLRSADFIFVNETEAELYSRRRGTAAVVRFWRSASRNAIIKLGPRGSRWIAGGEPAVDVAAAAPSVRAVDTTGAGDAFNGGFLVGWLRGRPPIDCLRLGNFVGAQSTLAPGGISSLPTRSAGGAGVAQLTRPNGPTRVARRASATRATGRPAR